MPLSVEPAPAHVGGHVVQLYDDRADVGASVGAFLAAGLDADEAALVVAAPELRDAIATGLRDAGIDHERAAAGGRLVWLDAAGTLDRLTTDGAVDHGRAISVLRALMDEGGRSGSRRVRVFGEMVASLWHAGDVTGAITLEDVWNRLGEELDFALFCAYPSTCFTTAGDVDAFHDMCAQHSQVLASRHLPPADVAPRAARRFVVETLHGWRRADVADAGALVVSELATNALLHARSPFTVTVSHGAGVVRIEVSDRDMSPPTRAARPLDAMSGRGMHLVEAMASRWGVDPTADGKVVWVELAAG